MKVEFIWLAIVACALASQSALSGDHSTIEVGSKLEFSVTPERRGFQSPEKVILVFRLRNVGNSDVLVSRTFRLDQHVLLRIAGPTGKEVPWCGRVDASMISSKSFAVLQPGASVSRAVRISCAESGRGGYQISGSGKYTVVATYHLTEPLQVLKQIAGKAVVVVGPIPAAEVSFWLGPGEPKPVH